jgi:ParB family chromosome partitioning protein
MKLSNSFVAVKKITSSVSRSNFSEDELNLAAELILKAEGVINPLVLRRTNPQSYEVVDGHFEYYAAARAKEIDSKKGEYIGAFVIEPENEEILQQQVEVLRKREPSNNDTNQKLESLTTQVAELAKSLKRIEKLESLTTQVAELDKSLKKIESSLDGRVKPPPKLNDITVKELQKVAKDLGIKGYTKMKRNELIRLIENTEAR